MRRSTNWFDQVTRNGFLQSHNVNLSGGSESLKYYFSLGYYGMDGIVKILEWTAIPEEVILSIRKINSPSVPIFSLPISWIRTSRRKVVPVIPSSPPPSLSPPNVTVRDQNGAYNKDPNNDFIANPVSLLDINDKIYTDKLNFSAGASYEVLPGLKPEIKLPTTYKTPTAALCTVDNRI